MAEYFKNRKILLFITTIQEAFGAAIPYFFLVSLVMLLLVVLNYLQIDFLWISRDFLQRLQKGLSLFSPLVIAVSIAHYSAIRLRIPQMIVGALTVAVYVTIALIEQYGLLQFLLPGFSVAVVFAPIASAYFLYLLYPYLSLELPTDDANRHIFKLFNYLFVFLAAYLVVMTVYYLVDLVLDWGLDDASELLKEMIPTTLYLAIRDIWVQIFWFFGIHGGHTVSLFFPYRDFSAEMVPHLTYIEFNRLFVTIGGAGAGMALLVSALMLARTRTLKIIARISVPFVLFNINTLLIYAFVVFNRFLLVPFLLVPLVNLTLAYGFIHLVGIEFDSFHVVWNLPIFVNGYLKTDGNLLVVLFQIFLVLVDTAIYYRAMRRFTEMQSLPHQLTVLSEKLNLQDEIAARTHVEAYQAYTEIIDANAELDRVLQNLNQNRMFVYYQPKIDVRSNRCNQFEALIRYWNNDGRLVGPVFLDTLEKAGMAPVIDLWVCQQVNGHLERWHEEGFDPEVSINLHPDTLRSANTIKRIVSTLEGKQVVFEIIERSFLDHDNAIENLRILQHHHHTISIDDFGYGYSNLEMLLNLQIDELKLDRMLINKIHEPKGEALCRNLTLFCHEIGMRVVAEGVETREQQKHIAQVGIDVIQGWYYSQALPFDKARAYAETFGRDQSDDATGM